MKHYQSPCSEQFYLSPKVFYYVSRHTLIQEPSRLLQGFEKEVPFEPSAQNLRPAMWATVEVCQVSRLLFLPFLLVSKKKISRN